MSYSYRLIPHLDLDAGVHATSSLGTEIRGATYDFFLNDHVLWVPFGVRGVLPVWRNRVEIFAGAGGVYERYFALEGTIVGQISRDGWGGQASGGASIALDRRRRFWLGGSSYFFFANTNNGFSHDRWVTATGDFGFRF